MDSLGRAFRWFALTLVVVWSLANVFHVVQRVTERNPLQDPGVVAAYEERFGPVREEVLGVKGLDRIGFVTDRPPHEVLTDFASVKDYYLTQYALAPIVLALGADRTDYVIASFSRTAIGKRTLPGFEPVQDWGDGVVLFKRLD